MVKLFVKAASLLFVLLAVVSCSGGSNGLTRAFDFNGNWETNQLTQKFRSDSCVDVLKSIPLSFPAFAYSVEQVGENITLMDQTGTLTGADGGDRFRVEDESGNPGEIVDPATLEPPFSDPNIECRVQTEIQYTGSDEFSGTILVSFFFLCVDRTSGETVGSCLLEYEGHSTKQ